MPVTHGYRHHNYIITTGALTTKDIKMVDPLI
jgi:hypothetical protein